MRAALLILRFTVCALLTALFCVDDWGSGLAPRSGQRSVLESPQVRVVADGESHLPADRCRKMIVGPGVNQPDPFPGYRGFVGWESPVRLRDGSMLVTFNAGYWHISWPTPLPLSWIDRLRHRYSFVVDFEAPMGGRVMMSRSSDEGVTWSKPRTLVDTPYDDRHPAITELSDGTLLCSFWTSPNQRLDSIEVDPSKSKRTAVVRSFDGGQTWEQQLRRLPPVFVRDATDGPVMEMPDGSILLTSYGKDKDLINNDWEWGRWVIGVFRSTDRGASWRLLSKIVTDRDQIEESMVRLQDGRLVMITRPEGAISWSEDEGRTWTQPVTFGFRMFAPTLQVLADGTLVCHYGCSNAKGLRAIFSRDGGSTWIAPARDHGFLIDDTYGYSRSCLLPDGSVYIAYIETGGHRTPDARKNAIWSIKLRIRPDHSGIELLPLSEKQK